MRRTPPGACPSRRPARALSAAFSLALAAGLATPARAADPSTYWLVPAERAAGAAALGVRVLEGAGAPRSDAAGGGPVALAHLTRFGRTSWTAEPGALELRAAPGVHLLALAAPPDATGAVRFAKALLVAPPADDPGALHRSEVGQTLELVPQDDPLLLARLGGTGFEVQVLFDREPLAGAEVVAAAGGGELRRGRTDEIGLAQLDLDRPGIWSLRVAHRGACADCAHPGARLWISTLTLTTGSR